MAHRERAPAARDKHVGGGGLAALALPRRCLTSYGRTGNNALSDGNQASSRSSSNQGLMDGAGTRDKTEPKPARRGPARRAPQQVKRVIHHPSFPFAQGSATRLGCNSRRGCLGTPSRLAQASTSVRQAAASSSPHRSRR